MDYVMHTRLDAPSAAAESLEKVAEKYGFVPNLAATMAQEPGLLSAYLVTEEAFRSSALSRVEQEVVALTVSFRNGCEYCMGGHSMLASMSGMTDEDLAALRNGAPMPTPRLEALRLFTIAALEARGSIPEDALRAFLDTGFAREHVLAIPTGIAFKMLSNLTHHLQRVPLDEPMAPFAWTPPENGGRRAQVLVSGWLRPDSGDALAEYQSAAGPIMGRHGGRPLLKSDPETSYVGSKPDLVVLMEFPSSEDARSAFADPEYTQLVDVREAAFSRLDVSKLG